jgi:CRP/FNR family transcriptional regulator, nitrogen fixation regulation protein
VITLYARETENGGSVTDLLRYSKGTVLYREGDPARFWYEIVSGMVRTCRFHADGHRQLTGFFYADDVFGVEHGRHSETAEAVTAVVIRRHPHDELITASTMDGTPSQQVLERALESARQCIFLLGHRTAANRVAAFLVAIAERIGAGEGVQLPMTRTDIADHLGLTIHTVSRTISDLARRGLIALNGPQKVRILDMRGLQSLAGEEAAVTYDSGTEALIASPGTEAIDRLKARPRP